MSVIDVEKGSGCLQLTSFFAFYIKMQTSSEKERKRIRGERLHGTHKLVYGRVELG